TAALIYKFVPDTANPYRPAGVGGTGRTANFLDLLWTRDGQLVAVMLDRCAPKPGLWSICTCASYSASGTLTSRFLDSGIEGCAWHRIQLDADVPLGTSIEVATQTSDQYGPPTTPFQPE